MSLPCNSNNKTIKSKKKRKTKITQKVGFTHITTKKKEFKRSKKKRQI